MQESTKGALLVLGAAAGFGTIGVFGELAAAIDLELATLLPYRFSAALLLVLGLAVARDWALPATRRERAATLALGVVYTGLTLFYFASLAYLTAGLATIVLYSYPVFVVVLAAAVLDEAVTPRKVAALALATAGVGLIVGTDTAGAEPVGVALALGAAACYAVYTTGSRTLSGSLAPEAMMVGALTGTTACMLAFGALRGGLAPPAGWREWGVVLGLAVVGTVAPLVLFYEGVARLEAGRVSVISTLEPVVTVALGALLLGEPVTPFVVAGGGLVLAALLLIHRARADSGESTVASAPVEGRP